MEGGFHPLLWRPRNQYAVANRVNWSKNTTTINLCFCKIDKQPGLYVVGMLLPGLMGHLLSRWCLIVDTNFLYDNYTLANSRSVGVWLLGLMEDL